MRWMVVLVVAACADQDGSGPYASLERLDTLLQHAECTRYVRCGMFETQTACEATIATGFSTSYLSPELANERAAGHLIYDGAMVQTCLDTIANQSCNPDATLPFNSIDECVQRAITPRLANGATCSHDWACISGACEGCDWLTTCCAGTCGPPSYPRRVLDTPLGAPCGSYAGCAPGLFCDDYGDQTCKTLIAEGQPCTLPGGPGELYGQRCADGLECDFHNNACKPPARLGEPCDLDCESLAMLCNSSGICVVQTPEGGACLDSLDCPSWLACTDGTCTANGVGEPCPCADSHAYCDYTDQEHPVCKARHHDGEACTAEYDQCESGFCDAGRCSSC